AGPSRAQRIPALAQRGGRGEPVGDTSTDLREEREERERRLPGLGKSRQVVQLAGELEAARTGPRHLREREAAPRQGASGERVDPIPARTARGGAVAAGGPLEPRRGGARRAVARENLTAQRPDSIGRRGAGLGRQIS